MTVFLDDLSMPLVNEWGDQPTLEFARQLVENGSFAFLEKDKRGDMKVCEDLHYVAAMGHPGGGRNDIPSRLKRHFLSSTWFCRLSPLSMTFTGRCSRKIFFRSGIFKGSDGGCGQAHKRRSQSGNGRKNDFCLRQFHYVFNMREVSRVFQGILLTPTTTIVSGGSSAHSKQALTICRLWKHECERVFCDKLVDELDKKKYLEQANSVMRKTFGAGIAAKVEDEYDAFVDFMGESVIDETGKSLRQRSCMSRQGAWKL